VWADADACATTLVALGLDRYAPKRPDGSRDPDPERSPLLWAPATWLQEVHDDTGVAIPPRSLDRLMAACVVLTRPHEFYASESGFGDLVTALAGVYFEPGVWHPPAPDEVLWALIEAHLLDPPEGPEERYSPGVVRYVNFLVREAGFTTLPDAFTHFGIPKDPTAWAGRSTDYPDDPEAAAAVAQSAADRERDLDADTADRVRVLAAQLAALPISNDPRPVAAELAAYAETLAGQGPPPPA
jgi:hypothetical protein